MIKLEGDKANLYQWDLNMRVVLINIPAGVEVHYSNVNDMSEVCEGTAVSYEENGNVYADIPNKVLQKYGILSVYIYVQNKDKAWTEHHAEIVVVARKKPANYVYTDNEVKRYDELDKRIAKLEEEGADVNPESIKTIVDDSLEEAKENGDFDGFSPTVEIAQTSEGHEVIITDANGKHKFPVVDGETPLLKVGKMAGRWFARTTNSGKSETTYFVIPTISMVEISDGYKIETTFEGGSQIVEIKHGLQGPQGIQGEKGEAFSIAKVYASVEEMEADFNNEVIKEGQFVLIDTGNVEDEDNAKLYIKGKASFNFVTDLSGATGMQGPQGIQGIQGPQGLPGYTPQRGTDFWTEADKDEIKAETKAYVDEAILGGAW